MKDRRLRGDESGAIKPAEILRIYGAVFPLYVDYVRREFIDKHIHPRRQSYAREDALRRVDELIVEVLGNRAEGRVKATVARERRKHAPGKRPARARKGRSSRLPSGRSLLRLYSSLVTDLKGLLPRRPKGEPIPLAAFREVRERYPELGWRRRKDSIGATPAGTAVEVLALRHGIKPTAVLNAVRQARARLA
jgi:hypothetical protein